MSELLKRIHGREAQEDDFPTVDENSPGVRHVRNIVYQLNRFNLGGRPVLPLSRLLKQLREGGSLLPYDNDL